MHHSVMTWATSVVRDLELAEASVLEVGSLIVNGSVRPLFNGPYVGVDMRAGAGVDQVALASALPFADEAFDVVVSTEMLEHDPAFWLSVPEMARVLRPGGHLLITARGNGFPAHDFPSDYWRFNVESFELLLAAAGLEQLTVIADPDPASPGVFGLGRKPAVGGDA